MKLRLEIKYTTSKKTEYISEIIMKNIKFVIINNIKYEKPINDSKKIQQYYYFVIKNSTDITEVLMDDETHFYLKNNKLHSYDTYCYKDSIFKYYAINGKLIPKDKEVFFFKKIKIK